VLGWMALGSTAVAAGAHTYDPSTSVRAPGRATLHRSRCRCPNLRPLDIGESAGPGHVNGPQATAATGRGRPGRSAATPVGPRRGWAIVHP